MALQKTISSDFGIDGNYIKIETIGGNKDFLVVDVSLYASNQARLDGKKYLENWVFNIPTPTGTGNDLLVDLYTHLKTLPEFSGAVDV